MRETKGIYTGVEKWTVCEFESLKEFYDYICNTPLNETFRWGELSSTRTNKGNWYGTNTFNEATDLFKNGWQFGAEELTKKLKVSTQVEIEHIPFLLYVGFPYIFIISFLMHFVKHQ